MSYPPIPIESLAEGKHVPQSMREAVQRALAKSPDDRFQTARSFIEAFSVPSAASTVQMVDDPAPARKTERVAPLGLGAPSESSAAEGPAVRTGPTPYTPIGGSMAFPTPVRLAEAGIAPPRKSRRRGILLAVAGIIAAGSALALALALKGDVHRDAGRMPDSPETGYEAVPATSISPADLGADLKSELPRPASRAGSDIPPLAVGSVRPQHPTQRAGPSGSSSSPSGASAASPSAHSAAGGDIPQGAAVASAPTLESLPSSGGGSPAASGPPTQATPSPASPGRYDGPECQKARILRAYGRNREARSWTLACLAKGGSI
jgi:serine/threonine-protein kinase